MRPPLPAAGERGQALLLLIGALAVVAVGAFILGGVARGVGDQLDQQRAADLAALAAARAMREAYPRLFEPALVGGRRNPRRLERAEYLALGRRTGLETARRNGASSITVAFPGARGLAPVRVRVMVADPVRVAGREITAGARAEAELAPAGADTGAGQPPGVGEYPGPFSTRQGKPMRPDVALAFDRLAAAARADGIDLVILSAFRSDVEQAALFAAHPDPKWVAPPGRSLHRLGTELDLGPASAYGWLRAHAARFHFVARYGWEPWHFGYGLNPASARLGYRYGRGMGGDGARAEVLPGFVPERWAPAISRAAQRWSVSATLLAAQLWHESRFNPLAGSRSGARGIARFTLPTAGRYGLPDPHDAEMAIEAQAHLMRDLLRRFGAVPLALAAYNAGPGPVQACGCVPDIPETVQYVADILGLLHGAGDPAGAGALALEVRLVS